MDKKFIKAKMLENDITAETLQEKLNISNCAYFYKMKHGTWTPLELIKLSELFGCSIDYLVKGE